MEASDLPKGAEDAARWAQVLTRDLSADGQFVYAVRTTGIYCRPSCPARRPLLQNVEFHRTPAQAEAAGYRACQRCKPTDGHSSRPHELARIMCARLDGCATTLSLSELATAVGLSPSHAHRLFRSVVGMTPRQYAAQGRAARLRAELHSGRPVARAMYEAGYGAPSRLYESVPRTLGMTPSRYKSGGAGLTIRYSLGTCSLGVLLVARTGRGVCSVALGDQESDLLAELRERFPEAQLVGPDQSLTAELAGVIALIESPSGKTSLPLDLQGTVFQKRVWSLLQEIPPGSTKTYKEIAERLGDPNGARAVARACATNPVALLIPCHRVIRSSGELAGYRWGIPRKKALLAREADAAALASKMRGKKRR